MSNPFVIFWSILIITSIAWYGGLVFYIGFKAGRDILGMIKSLNEKAGEKDA